MSSKLFKQRAIIILIGLTVFISQSKAQSAFILEATQYYSSFKFLDTQSHKLNSEYQGLFTGAYGIGYKYQFDSPLILKVKLGLRNAGANLVYDEMNYSWKLQYADLTAGLGYIHSFGRFNPYILVSGYLAYLMRGTQVLNNEEFNITESEILNPLDMGIIFTPGCELKISDVISAYAEFSYLWGLKNIEMDEGQNTSNYGMGLTLGLSFTITSLTQ
jgi:hypothetical protein